MYVPGTRVVEDLHAINIVRSTMSHWFDTLDIKFGPLADLDCDFYTWQSIQWLEDGASVLAAFKLHRNLQVQIYLRMEWYGPNAALIRTFTVEARNRTQNLGLHIVRRKHPSASWRVHCRHHTTDKCSELKKLLAA